jgi:2-phospho-L-lactate guanylyltransferase
MTYWAIVPVKPLRRAKSRLAGVLSDDERALLSQHLLQHTLGVLKEIPEIERTLVVSRCSDIDRAWCPRIKSGTR